MLVASTDGEVDGDPRSEATLAAAPPNDGPELRHGRTRQHRAACHTAHEIGVARVHAEDRILDGGPRRPRRRLELREQRAELAMIHRRFAFSTAARTASKGS